MKRLAPSLILLVSVGCGSIGNETPSASQVLNGGTGPFRIATQAETGIMSNPAGQMFSIYEPVGRAQLTETAVFYEVANWPTMAGTRDPSLPYWEIDWNQWAPRRIARSTQHVVDAASLARLAYVPGVDVLAPTLSWETTGIGEPAIVRRADGSVRLYYATDQGIGIAEAPTVDGTFTRLVANPILPDVDGHGPASSPAPVEMPSGETLMYVSAGGAIYVARSTDGLAFTLVDLDPSTAAVDPISLPAPVVADDAGVSGDASVDDAGIDGGVDAGVPITEVEVRAPTALVAQSPIGRLLVRLYFEVRRSDGTSALAMAASFDGLSFVRAPTLAYVKSNPTRPACFLRADGITLLTFAIPRNTPGAPWTFGMLGSTPGDLALPPP